MNYLTYLFGRLGDGDDAGDIRSELGKEGNFDSCSHPLTNGQYQIWVLTTRQTHPLLT